MKNKSHNLLLHRTFQYLGIILIVAAMGGGYWYWKQAQAGMKINDQTGKGLSIYMPLDEGVGLTTANAEKPGATGALNLSPTWTDGKFGKALNFSGGSYMDYDCSSGGCPTSYPFTVSLWFNAASTSTGLLWGLYNTGLNQQSAQFSSSYLHLSSSSTYRGIPLSYINTNTWYHLTIVYRSASDMTGYLDGVNRTVASDDFWGFSCSGHMMIGARIGACNGNRNYSGKIDDVRIYGRELSASEILENYKVSAKNVGGKVNSSDSQGDSLEKGMVGYWKLDDGSGTSATDASGNGNTGTLTNGPTWTTGQIGGATDFDGTDDYVTTSDINALDGLTQMTVSAWVLPDTAGLDDYEGIVSKRTSDTNRFTMGRGGSVAGGTDDVYVGIGDGSNSYGYTTSGVLASAQWTHLMMVFDGSQTGNSGRLKFYKNGEAQNLTFSGTIPASTPSSNTGTLLFGYEGSLSRYFGGNIDEVRIYNRALSAEEVAKLYRTTTPDDPDQGLVGYWPFNGPDISGTTAFDRSGKGNNGTLTNSPTKTIGKIGQGMQFDGTNDYVNLGTTSTAFNFANNLSASAWIKTSVSGRLIFQYQNSNPLVYMSVGGTTAGGTANKFVVYLRTNSGAVAVFNSNRSVNDNDWHHVAFTRDTSTQKVRLFIDGVLDLDSTYTDTGAIDTSGGDHRIGLHSQPAYAFSGSIDEPRVYNRALSAGEIWDLYQMGAADKVNSADSQSDSLEQGLVGYWKLDDGSGTSAADASGNANTGTLTNGPTWTTGRIGGAVDFDGTDDYIPTTNLYGSPQNFTISSWFKTSSASGKKIIGFEGDRIGTASSSYDRHIYIGTDGKARFGWWVGAIRIIESAQTLHDGTWHHVVGTYTSSGAGAFYVDGVLQGTNSGVATDYNGYWRIGSYKTSGSWTNGVDGYFPGSIDEVRVYNRALSAEEVAKLYKTTTPDDPDTGLVGYWPFNGKDISGPTAFDRSGKGNNGTLTNGPTKTIGKIGQGMQFDGTDDSVVVGNSTTLNPAAAMSVSAWVFRRSDTATYHLLVYKENYAGNAGYVLGKLSGAAPLGFRVNGSSGNSYTAYESSATYNEWIHYIGVFDGDKVYLYKNGVLVDTEDPPFTTISADTDILEISAAWNGKIDEPRIYNRALTQAEVTALYNAGR